MTHKGLGDTVEAIVHAVGGDKAAKAYEALTGKPCGCCHRKEVLNELFPYDKKQEGNPHIHWIDQKDVSID